MVKKLVDMHTHIEDIRLYSDTLSKKYGHKIGGIYHKGASASEIKHHILKNNLDTLVAIYESEGRIKEVAKECRGLCKILGYYWIRKPKEICDAEKRKIEHLYSKGFISGLKIHPVVDDYHLTEENIRGVLELASKYGLPLLFHTDDRLVTQHLTNPDLYEGIIRKYPSVKFIIGHGGAFTHPRIVPNSPVAKSYWNKERKPFSIFYAINRALKIAQNYENTFYETSIVNNKIKSRIIVDFINQNAKVAKKILIGTDFPLGIRATVNSQINSLRKQGLKEDLIEVIKTNRIE